MMYCVSMVTSKLRGTPRACGRARLGAYLPLLRNGDVCSGCATQGPVSCDMGSHKASPLLCLTARSISLNWEDVRRQARICV